MLREPNILLLSADQSETAQIQQLLGEHAIVTPVERRSELISLLERGDYDAIFCAWSFRRGTWSDVLEDVRELRPDLPVIVLSATPENRDFAEVLEAGAFDLLVPPYETHSVLAVLEQASASREAASTYNDRQWNARA